MQGLCHFDVCPWNCGRRNASMLVCSLRSHISRRLQSSACLFSQTSGAVLRSANGDVSLSLVYLSGGES